MAISFGAGALNLVPNPSFTDLYDPTDPNGCPKYVSELAKADKWLEGNNADPDYFHNCGTGFAKAPDSDIAIQDDATESLVADAAYAGLIVYTSRTGPGKNLREYVEAILTHDMVQDNVYFISFAVSLAEGSGWAIEDFGAWIGSTSIGPLPGSTSPKTLALTPQIVNAQGILNDPTRWVQISGFYKAVGGEDRIVIGNFLDDVDTINVEDVTEDPAYTTSASPKLGYYLIDKIEVTWVCDSLGTLIDFNALAFPGTGAEDLGCYYFEGEYTYGAIAVPPIWASQADAPYHAGKTGLLGNLSSLGSNGLSMSRSDGDIFNVCSVMVAEGPDEVLGIAPPGQTEIFAGRTGGATAASQVVSLDMISPYEEPIQLDGFNFIDELFMTGGTDYQWTGACACYAGPAACNCTEPHAQVTNHFRRYCVEGASNGSGFAWKLDPTPGVWVDVPPAVVPLGAAAEVIVSAFVDSLRANGIKSRIRHFNRKCLVIKRPPSTIQLVVGGLGGTNPCVATGNPLGCNFNPKITEAVFLPPHRGSAAYSPLQVLAPLGGPGFVALLIVALGASGLWIRRGRSAPARAGRVSGSVGGGPTT